MFYPELVGKPVKECRGIVCFYGDRTCLALKQKICHPILKPDVFPSRFPLVCTCSGICEQIAISKHCSLEGRKWVFEHEKSTIDLASRIFWVSMSFRIRNFGRRRFSILAAVPKLNGLISTPIAYLLPLSASSTSR